MIQVEPTAQKRKLSGDTFAELFGEARSVIVLADLRRLKEMMALANV